MTERRARAESQLTARSLAAGAVIGGVLCVANVYVVLKTGWSLGVTLSSTIIAFGAFRALERLGLVRAPLGLLENATISSTASAAAFMTGGGHMAALPALVMLTGHRPGALALFVWFAVIAALGVVTAIPLKRRVIDEEPLPFPLGAATASTMRAMHAGDRGRHAVTLFGAALVSGVDALARAAIAARPEPRAPRRRRAHGATHGRVDVRGCRARAQRRRVLVLPGDGRVHGLAGRGDARHVGRLLAPRPLALGAPRRARSRLGALAARP